LVFFSPLDNTFGGSAQVH